MACRSVSVCNETWIYEEIATLPSDLRVNLVLPRRVVVGAALGLLTACSPGRDLPLLADYQTPAYRLGVGDRIRVVTFGEAQLTGEFQVDDQGRILLPLLGSFDAMGRTPEELGTSIAAGLKRRDLIRNPDVTVTVMAYRPIYILGEVARPGQFPYQPGMTLLTVVAIAGGFTYRAVQNYGSVIRTTNGVALEGKVTPSSFMAPGDVVKIFERLF